MTIVVVTGSAQLPLIERLQHDFKGFVTADKIVSAYDVNAVKPQPDPYLIGLQKAGNLQPWQGLVVENAPMGVRSGCGCTHFLPLLLIVAPCQMLLWLEKELILCSTE